MGGIRLRGSLKVCYHIACCLRRGKRYCGYVWRSKGYYGRMEKAGLIVVMHGYTRGYYGCMYKQMVLRLYGDGRRYYGCVKQGVIMVICINKRYCGYVRRSKDYYSYL